MDAQASAQCCLRPSNVEMMKMNEAVTCSVTLGTASLSLSDVTAATTLLTAHSAAADHRENRAALCSGRSRGLINAWPERGLTLTDLISE